MSPPDLVQLFVALGALLWLARFLGETARRFGQPAVLGELLAGILLGPTALGRLAPSASAYLAPSSGPVAGFASGFSALAVVLLLFMAGLEIDLGSLSKQRRVAGAVSLSGIVVPFAFGFAATLLFPGVLVAKAGVDPLTFRLFFATALAISALPVIAKTLLDLGLYRTDVGRITMAAAVIDDLVGWLLFSLVLARTGAGEARFSTPVVAALTLGFAVFMLTVFRRGMAALLPWLERTTGKTLSFCLSVALFAAAATEWIGVHALFGAFVAGVALGDARLMDGKTKRSVQSFVGSFFAPIFFAGIGLRVDFVRSFAPALVALVVVVACAGKILGCGLAALASGLPKERAWMIGICMNARGAMEIVLGLVALRHGLIDERLFVALVVMALVTSVLVGPAFRALGIRAEPGAGSQERAALREERV